MNTILVIGGSGFVGSKIVTSLIARNDLRVIIFDQTQPDPALLQDRFIKYLKGSILNFGELAAALKTEQVNQILHTSYIYSSEASERPFEAAKYNFLGTVNVLEASRLFNVAKVVYASAGAVYGNLERSAVVREDHPKTPQDFYGASKLSSENYGRLYREKYGIKFTALRMMGGYGPDLALPTVSYQVTNGLIQRVLKQAQVFIDIEPDELVTLAHMDDAIEAFTLSLERETPSPAYNLASETVTFGTIVDLLKQCVPTCQIELSSSKAKDTRDLYLSQHIRGFYDISLIKRDLGFQPKHFISEEMKVLVDYQKSKLQDIH